VKPARTIESLPWMAAPETRAVVAALTAEGAEVRFVGGCVRDSLLGRAVRDVDIATHDAPEVALRLLEAAGIRAIPTGVEHGTVTAVIGGEHFEITTLRVDVETYGRRAKVAFTDDWRADAARRDFTINSLFLAPDGTLYDPFGGLADLEAGRVRFVGEAEQRIREDVLRLLRFFRFYAEYGRPPPDAAALAACRALAPLLSTLSAERVAGELFRLLLAPDPAAVFRLMAENGVLDRVLAEGRRLDRLAALVTVERAAGLAGDPVRRLVALLAAEGPAAAAIARRLRLSNAQRDRLADLAAPAVPMNPGLAPPARRLALYRLGAERFRDAALLAWAEAVAAGGAAPDAAEWGALLAFAETAPVPVLPVKGRDAVDRGVPRGPEVGRLIEAVEAWWIEGDFTADRAACLGRLEALIDARGESVGTARGETP